MSSRLDPEQLYYFDPEVSMYVAATPPDKGNPVQVKIGFVVLILSLCVCGILSFLYLQKKDKIKKLNNQTCPEVPCDDPLAKLLAHRTFKLEKSLAMTTSFEFGKLGKSSADVKEYNIKVYCSWEVLSDMAESLSSSTDFDETDIVAQIIGNADLSRKMLKCPGLEDVSSVPDRTKFAFQVVIMTDDLQQPSFMLVKVFFDREFLNMYTQIQQQASNGMRFLGIEIGNRLEDYILRAFMLSPLYIRMEKMQFKSYFDSNDSVQQHNMINFLQHLYSGSPKNRNVQVMIRKRPSDCPYVKDDN